ncbi:hypothetical protein BJP65_05960 [Microbacterium sp. BH-3-3-3]|nr:hypothetical protein BJP65_05960 [Microbacterium sp. BH-3-3-3]
MLSVRVASLARRRGAVAAALYLVTLGVIVFWPVHLERRVDFLYDCLYAVVPAAAAVDLDVIANVVFLIPFGVLLARLLPGHPWLLLGIAWTVPLLVEIAQGVFLPGRTSSAIDVAANTLGGVMGAIGVGIRRRYVTRRDTRRMS